MRETVPLLKWAMTSLGAAVLILLCHLGIDASGAYGTEETSFGFVILGVMAGLAGLLTSLAMSLGLHTMRLGQRLLGLIILLLPAAVVSTAHVYRYSFDPLPSRRALLAMAGEVPLRLGFFVLIALAGTSIANAISRWRARGRAGEAR